MAARVDAAEKLDPDTEELVSEIATDFVRRITEFAAKLAKHRNSDTLEAKDGQLILDRKYNIRVPGYQPTDDPADDAPARRGRPPARAAAQNVTHFTAGTSESRLATHNARAKMVRAAQRGEHPVSVLAAGGNFAFNVTASAPVERPSQIPYTTVTNAAIQPAPIPNILPNLGIAPTGTFQPTNPLSYSPAMSVGRGRGRGVG
ncbi:transcription initiation factor TFIID subunit A-domain-containing protein [Cladochytrium replicatum]|nr:transcription initiation factor TFIID subunit A-domain-containing protein [Cladochytrium replicatum]